MDHAVRIVAQYHAFAERLSRGYPLIPNSPARQHIIQYMLVRQINQLQYTQKSQIKIKTSITMARNKL
jgi:hypothetical protein